MGYACPVCGVDQPDGEHLANHMAFTAMLRSDDHEDWLDDRVPHWPDMNPESLAPEITPHASETETELVTDDGRHPHGMEGEMADHGGYGRESLSSDQQAVFDEAQALTRQMYGLDETDTDAADGTGDAGNADSDPEGDDDTDSESQ